MRKLRIITLCRMTILTLLLLSLGCASARSINVKGSYPAKPKAHPIEVFNRGDRYGNTGFFGTSPDKIFGNFIRDDGLIPAHIVIGGVNATGALAVSWERMVENAKERAREQGGDAIIIREYGAWVKGTTNLGTSSQNGMLLNVDVIRFVNP